MFLIFIISVLALYKGEAAMKAKAYWHMQPKRIGNYRNLDISERFKLLMQIEKSLRNEDYTYRRRIVPVVRLILADSLKRMRKEKENSRWFLFVCYATCMLAQSSLRLDISSCRQACRIWEILKKGRWPL